MYTKESPGCYHSLINFLATIESTEQYKVLTFYGMDELYKWNKPKTKRKLQYKSYDIQVISGTEKHAFIKDNKRFDVLGITPDKFEVTVLKNVSDFKTQVNHAGSYKDSLGGGWHQTVSLYECNGSYFATMDCACN